MSMQPKWHVVLANFDCALRNMWFCERGSFARFCTSQSYKIFRQLEFWQKSLSFENFGGDLSKLSPICGQIFRRLVKILGYFCILTWVSMNFAWVLPIFFLNFGRFSLDFHKIFLEFWSIAKKPLLWAKLYAPKEIIRLEKSTYP